ncbi:hypothetical protein PRUPE_2G307800 [Prunus persica]|uniref:Bidirectional sugar transporter SWEET n=1 Tax=Prunus persica TaxID=3760 RepID=M5XTL2_PRUPE|nr:hypothetical protein PRUPE_2G307800 [Prunus persica]
MARIIRKKSTEEFSCVPYITALLNCLLYTCYALPVVSYSWENFPLVTINGLGMNVAVIMIPVIIVFCITAIISAFVFHNHHHRTVFVGSVALVASVAMYAAPLVVVKQVILTKSVEFMPFYLSFFSFLSSSLWMAYGLLSRDIFVTVLYRKRGTQELPNKWDFEEVNDKNPKQVVICQSANTES